MNYTPTGWAINGIESAGNQLGAINVRESSSVRTDITTAVSSNINVGNNFMLNSVGDTTITAANINVGTDAAKVTAGGGNLLANAQGNFVVNAATNSETISVKNSYETAGTFHSDLSVGHVNYRAGVSKDINESGSESSTSSLVSSNINVGGSSLINTTDQFALTASNIVTAGTTIIAANNSLSIADGQNKQSTSQYSNNLNLDTGIQVGNAYADVVNAALDAVDAMKKVKDAEAKLERIENLHDNDQASQKAVDRAQYQLALSMFNAGLLTAQAFQSAYAAYQAGTTSLGTGFYGSAYADITNTKFNASTDLSQSQASNILSGNSINLTSGNSDINITGSNVSSQNGDINLIAMFGNINIKAGETTQSQESKSSSQLLGGSVGNNGANVHVGFQEAESSLDQITYTNSTLTANNGAIKLNSKQV